MCPYDSRSTYTLESHGDDDEAVTRREASPLTARSWEAKLCSSLLGDVREHTDAVQVRQDGSGRKSPSASTTSTVDSLTAVGCVDFQDGSGTRSAPASATSTLDSLNAVGCVDLQEFCISTDAEEEQCFDNVSPHGARSGFSSRCGTSQASVEGLPQFDSERFRYQRRLTAAPRSCGQIELYYDCAFGCTVAVKHVPHQSLRSNPEAFRAANPNDPESPWQEFATLEQVGSDGAGRVQGVARYHGTFTNSKGDALLVIEYFPDGDLFAVASRLGEPSYKREVQVFPLVSSLIEAVHSLHKNGIAHGDVSLENAMWRPSAPGHNQVALIDFGASASSSTPLVKGRRGKPSYQAPEMHSGKPYEAKAADLFALGVAIYALVLKGYPWSSTRQRACRAFVFARRFGMEAYFAKRRVTTADGTRRTVDEIVSPFTRHLLLALLDCCPRRRVDAFNKMAASVVPSLVQASYNDWVREDRE